MTLNRCQAKGNPKAGYLFKNERPKSVVLDSCRDEGSAYGLVIEYGVPAMADGEVETLELVRKPA